MLERHSESLVRTRHCLLLAAHAAWTAGLQTLAVGERGHRQHPTPALEGESHLLFAGQMQTANRIGGGFGVTPAKCEARSPLGLVMSGTRKLRAMFRGQIFR